MKVKILYLRIFKKVIQLISNWLDYYTTKNISTELNSIGKSPIIKYPINAIGLSAIRIGNNVNLQKDFKLRAYEVYNSIKYCPSITIGDNFYSGTNSCISAIGEIFIGNNVTIASRVTIIDHSHGELNYKDIETPVMQRKLVNKGPISIEDNVWIGENVVVVAGVTIGKNSVIGANSVVTKDIPEYTIAAGVPAKVIKIIEKVL
jgi:acetyltransferase-like isoleucine patch superfamily enzyme